MELERLKEEDCLIQFEDEDHADLVKIFSTIETKDEDIRDEVIMGNPNETAFCHICKWPSMGFQVYIYYIT